MRHVQKLSTCKNAQFCNPHSTIKGPFITQERSVHEDKKSYQCDIFYTLLQLMF